MGDVFGDEKAEKVHRLANGDAWSVNDEVRRALLGIIWGRAYKPRSILGILIECPAEDLGGATIRRQGLAIDTLATMEGRTTVDTLTIVELLEDSSLVRTYQEDDLLMARASASFCLDNDSLAERMHSRELIQSVRPTRVYE